MQLEIMLFFQRIQNPVLSFLANLFSAFAEESLMIVILITIYWCFDKKKGFAIFSSLFLSLITMRQDRDRDGIFISFRAQHGSIGVLLLNSTSL